MVKCNEKKTPAWKLNTVLENDKKAQLREKKSQESFENKFKNVCSTFKILIGWNKRRNIQAIVACDHVEQNERQERQLNHHSQCPFFPAHLRQSWMEIHST